MSPNKNNSSNSTICINTNLYDDLNDILLQILSFGCMCKKGGLICMKSKDICY